MMYMKVVSVRRGERQGGRRWGGARIKREGQEGGGGDIPYFLIKACAVFITQGPQVKPTYSCYQQLVRM